MDIGPHWNIADDRLRDMYVRGKYRDVILSFTVLRRLDAVLESTKQAVLERKKLLDTHKVAEQDGALRMARMLLPCRRNT
ncbi:type I restriction enzyme M protein [Nitrosomonas eutropha]|uniref:type I restriction-modification system subunit M N-terminal domain-containing protein n=1 Tax=Nitrosomonas TaxID=914 RepID=UPI00088BF7BF|nr:type I restriction-modification system subunit M N-terminal domain-containing protein [Nitrosomonas eutropha]SCX27136.1 type I restriction enzyme M protein [Nitrosomonas eutropha]SDX02988.1 type I restriction enzyme M protein [Nitrosomonas eutropha]